MVRANVIPAKSARQFGDVCLLDNTARKSRFPYFSDQLLKIDKKRMRVEKSFIIVYRSKSFYKAENYTAKISLPRN